MQKVVGSSPIIRSLEAPANAGVSFNQAVANTSGPLGARSARIDAIVRSQQCAGCAANDCDQKVHSREHEFLLCELLFVGKHMRVGVRRHCQIALADGLADPRPRYAS